jgi:predicted CopG family antitoxin
MTIGTKTIKVSDEVWTDLYKLKIATNEKTINDVIIKLMKGGDGYV